MTNDTGQSALNLSYKSVSVPSDAQCTIVMFEAFFSAEWTNWNKHKVDSFQLRNVYNCDGLIQDPVILVSSRS